MFDLKAFREENNLKQGEVADYLGVSFGFISQIERKKAKLSRAQEKMLQGNDRGWVIPDSAPAQKESVGGDLLQVIVAKIDEQNARFAEQNAQIDRLLTIIQQLTEKK